MQRYRSKRALSDDETESSGPRPKSNKKEITATLARDGFEIVAPAAAQQWSFVTTRKNTSPYVDDEEKFAMYEVYMSVNDAKRGITALADVDDGMICDEWNEQFGAYGELTLDSRGGNIGILSEAIIYEVIRKPIRAAGYIDPPKPKKKKTHTVYVQNFALGTAEKYIETIMVPDRDEAGLIQSRLVHSRFTGLAYVDLVFSSKESAEDIVTKFHNARVWIDLAS